MTERRKRVLAAALMAILLVIVGIRLTVPSRGTGRASSEPVVERGAVAAAHATAPTPVSPVELAKICLHPRSNELRLPERDLFSPAPPPRREEPVSAGPQVVADRVRWARELRSLRLSATLQDGSSRIAVINGKTLREGDELAGFALARVEAGRVILTRGGETFVLQLGES